MAIGRTLKGAGVIRLSEITREQMDSEQAALYADLIRGPRGAVTGPFIAWMHAPVIGKHLDKLGKYLRFQSSLSDRIAQLSILQTLAFWRSAFAWNRHVALARSMRIEEDVIVALRSRIVPSYSDPIEGSAYGAVEALLHTRTIVSMDWDPLVAAFGEKGLVDLVALVGYYGLVALTLAATGLNDSEPDPFPSDVDDVVPAP